MESCLVIILHLLLVILSSDVLSEEATVYRQLGRPGGQQAGPGVLTNGGKEL